MPLKDYIVDRFKGFANRPEPNKVAPGVITNGLNWIVTGAQNKEGADKMELRRGYYLLGTDAGAGKVTGLRSIPKADGTELLYKTYLRKLEYYDTTAEDWTEVGTNIFPTAASGEDISIEPYESLAGAAGYLSSPNSSIYKIMPSSPDSYIDLVATSQKGKIRINNNRMILWNNLSSSGQQDNTGWWGSKIDKDTISDYTAVDDEVADSGDGTTKTFTGTLAFKAAGAKRSCFAVIFTDGTETFNDDYSGVLTGDQGGTGTINYITGAYSITFNSAPANSTDNITVDYNWEDPTSGGIADFAFSATRVAGEGFYIPHGDGAGNAMSSEFFEGSYYLFHKDQAWKLTITANDDSATNLPYRHRVGVPNHRATVGSGEAIYYLDSSEEKAGDVALRILELERLTGSVVPNNISPLILFEDYRFDDAVLQEWGDYIVLACKTADTTENNRLFLYDRVLNMWSPPQDLQASCMEVYNGTLVAGDSTTKNAYQLFSGFDDDDSLIPNFIEMEITKAGVFGLKKTKRIVVEGEIQEDQQLKVYASYDRGDFVEVATVDGNGSYVDIGSDIAIGQVTIGQKVIGSGDVATANHYRLETKINSDNYNDIQLRFEATKIGYVSVYLYSLKDNRYKGRKSVQKYIN